jgi:hypothetical protein
MAAPLWESLRAVRVKRRVHGVKRPCPTLEEASNTKTPRMGSANVHVCPADHTRDGVMSGTFAAGTLHQPYLRVGIVSINHWSPWECIAASHG